IHSPRTTRRYCDGERDSGTGPLRGVLSLRGHPAGCDRARQAMHHRHDRGRHLRLPSALEPHRRRLCAEERRWRQQPRSRPWRAAALANGALAHAFEMDNLTWPSTGVHPGATLLASGLAVAQERGMGGRELLTAVVAGAEVMIRIGRATKHSNEGRGFHAPGTT